VADRKEPSAHPARQESTPPDVAGLMSQSDQEYLSAYVSEHMLAEISRVLAACELPVREAIVRVLCEQAEAFGDRVLILALARVGYAADPPPPDSPGAGE